MRNSKHNLLSVTAFLVVSLLILISLPYPWCGLSSRLETLITKQNECHCLCPWWLFVVGQIVSSYFLFLLARTPKKHSKVKYVVLQAGIGIFFFVYHHLVHNYYIGKSMFEASVFCNWVWLIMLGIVLLFSIFPIYGEEDAKDPI